MTVKTRVSNFSCFKKGYVLLSRSRHDFGQTEEDRAKQPISAPALDVRLYLRYRDHPGSQPQSTTVSTLPGIRRFSTAS